MTKLSKHVALFFAVAIPFFAGYSAPDGAHPRLEKRIQKVVDELGLTDDQKAQVVQIMEESQDARRKIFEDHGITFGSGERPSPEQMKEIRPELKALRESTHEKLKAILSDEQISKLEERPHRGQREGEGKREGKPADEE